MSYFDYNATAPLRPGVLAAMAPYWGERVGNPSSMHASGRLARRGLDEARRLFATRLGVPESGVVLLSGATEANHLALLGLVGEPGCGGRVLVGAVEHPSVLGAAATLARRGVAVEYLPVDGEGRVRLEALREGLRAGPVAVVSLLHAHNETGVVQPVAEVATLCREAGVPWHCDAVQTVGRRPVTLAGLGASLLSFSAHKFGGPKGVGGLVVAEGIRLLPMLTGGGQERGLRSGTENLPGVVGAAAAFAAAGAAMADEAVTLAGLRERFEAGLLSAFGERCLILGRGAERLANTTAFCLEGVSGETLAMNLDLAGMAVSSGSACSSGRGQGSPMVRAMGLPESWWNGMVRVSLGWDHTEAEVDQLLVALRRTATRLWQMGAG